MPDFAYLYSDFAAAWGAAIGRACWQGSLALLLAWLLCRLPRLSPQIQCWLWRLAYLKLLVALCWARPIDLPLLPPPPAPPPLLLPDMTLTTTRNGAGTTLYAPVLFTRSSPPQDPAPVWRALCALWLAGSLGFGLRVVWDWRNIRRLCANCRPMEDPRLMAVCSELCADQGIRRQPDLLLQEGAGYPQLVGGLYPAIILPRDFWSTCTEMQQRLILTHELAHVRRYDLLWSWMPLVGRCLFFFLPPVWLAEREWQQSQEMACDEQVLRLTSVARSEYGNVLLNIALLPRPQLTSGLIAVRIAESYSVVHRRLLAMKHAGKTSRRTLVASGALLTTAAVAGVIPWRVSAQDASKQNKQAAEKQLSDAAFQKKLMMGQAGLSPELAEQLQLNKEQMRQTKCIAAQGAHQVMQLLTPEQQQVAMPKGTGWPDVLMSLDLTDAQKIKIKTLRINQEQQLRALKTDEALSPGEHEDEVKRIAQQCDDQLRQILTPGQWEQMTALLKQQQTDENWLHLTEEQQAKMVEMKRSLGSHVQALSEDQTLTEAERKVRIGALTRGPIKIKTLEQILTPEQRQLMAAHEEQMRANSEVGPLHLVNLERVSDITPAQRSRIQAVYAEAKQQFVQLLTPTQRQKLQQLAASGQQK